MRATVEDVVRRGKAETWEKVCPIEKIVDTHEVKIQEHYGRFQDLENAVADQPADGNSDTSTRAGGSSDWVEQHVAFRVCDFEEKNVR